MKNNDQSSIESRLERDLSVWDRIQARQVARYGQGVLKDRGFLAAKREMYQHIMEKYVGKRPNMYERAEMKVLQSQRRELLRRMYPNPVVRMLRNLAALTVNLIRIAGRMTVGGVRGATVVLTGPQRVSPYSKSNVGARQAMPDTPRQSNSNVQQTRKQVTPASPAVVRKLPPKPRIVPKPAKSKGMRR